MTLRRIVPLLVATATLPTVAAGQGRISWNGVPAVGSWAEYALTVTQDAKTSSGSYRVACVGRERRGGADLLWCEIVRTKGDKARVIKVLLPEDATTGTDDPLARAVEVVYQDGTKSALRAEGATLQSVVSLLQTIQGDEPMKFDSEGREEVALPGGKKTVAFKKTGSSTIELPGQDAVEVTSELWVVRDVPFGVARRVVTTTRGSGVTEEKKVETLELESSGGSGAVSRITGPIKPFSLMELLSGR